MNGHSLKLHFCMFERSKVKHNNLDSFFFWKYFSLIAKFTCFKLNRNQNVYMFKAFKLEEWTIFVFFQTFFFTKCAPFLLKIEEDFNID